METTYLLSFQNNMNNMNNLDLHPYYIDNLLQQSFAWKFDLDYKYNLLSQYCFPDLTPENLKQLLPSIQWDDVVKLSLFYTPIIESKGLFQPLTLYYKALKANFPGPEYFVEDILSDRIELHISVVLSVLARIYNRENIYKDIIKQSLYPDVVRCILLEETSFVENEDILRSIVDILLNMIGISSLDICIIIQRLPSIGVISDVQSGMRGQITNLYSLYGSILSYNDERIANYLEISTNDNLLDDIRKQVVRFARYLNNNIIQFLPISLLKEIYNSLSRKGQNILGCYNPNIFPLSDRSSYFTSESYLQYYMNETNEEINENSVYNDIGVLGYRP